VRRAPTPVVAAGPQAFKPLTVAELAASGSILVLAPHPDDEVLGCGGLLAAAFLHELPAHVTVLTDGAASHAGIPQNTLRALRRAETCEAIRRLGGGGEAVSFLAFPDGGLPCEDFGFDLAVEAVAATIREHGVGTLIAPWSADPHPDHIAASRIARAACRGGGSVRLLEYATWGWVRPALIPLPAEGVAIDVRQHVWRRRWALQAHRSQIGAIPSLREEFSLPDELKALVERPIECLFDPK
jgi:LmbE family N-acetylglucosaminyl deacetylase